MELVAALLAGLSMCGINGPGIQAPNMHAPGNISPAGIYAGSLRDATGGTEDLAGIIDESGNAAFWDYQTFTVLRFKARPECGYFGTSFTAYAGPPGREFATGRKKTSGFISGTVAPRTDIAGALIFRGGTADSYAVDFQASDYDTPASFANVSGTYQAVIFLPAGPDRVTLTISPNGELEIIDTAGCAYSGFVTIPDAAHNVYDLRASGTCVNRGEARVSGLAYYTPGTGSQPTTMTVIYDNGLDFGVRLVATRQ